MHSLVLRVGFCALNEVLDYVRNKSFALTIEKIQLPGSIQLTGHEVIGLRVTGRGVRRCEMRGSSIKFRNLIAYIPFFSPWEDHFKRAA